MNRDEYFKRAKGILKPDALRDSTIAIVGLGSGGGRIVEESVRWGIKRMLLLDRPGERMEEHNVPRHVLGYSSLGRLKTEALRDRLWDINPDCEVIAVSLDVSQDPEALYGIVRQCDLVFLCTDNEPSKHAVNDAVVRARIPMVFAAAFDGGCGGEVGRVMPGEACYACMATYLRISSKLPAPEEVTFDYSNPNNPDLNSTSALNMDIAQIALLQARVGLITLLELAGQPNIGQLEGNYLIFGNRAVEGVFPRMLHSEFWTIKRNPSCMVCQGAGVDDEAIAQEAAAILAGATAADAE